MARRDGDSARYYADVTFAKKKIGWEAESDLEKMCIDAWNFQKKSS